MNCAVLFWRKKGIFFATQKIFICHASHFSTKLQVSNCSIFSRKFTCYEIRNCLFFAWQTLPSIKFREKNAKLFSAELDTRTWKYFWTNIDERGQISKSVSKMVFVEEFVLFFKKSATTKQQGFWYQLSDYQELTTKFAEKIPFFTESNQKPSNRWT